MKSNLKVAVLGIFLVSFLNLSAQSKQENFHKILEIAAFDVGMKIAKPIMKTTLEESMYTDENKKVFGGKKGIKKIINVFIERFDPNYISNLFYNDVISSKYSEKEIDCLVAENCDNEVKERWKGDYEIFESNTEKYAAKYGEELMLKVIADVNK